MGPRRLAGRSMTIQEESKSVACPYASMEQGDNQPNILPRKQGQVPETGAGNKRKNVSVFASIEKGGEPLGHSHVPSLTAQRVPNSLTDTRLQAKSLIKNDIGQPPPAATITGSTSTKSHCQKAPSPTTTERPASTFNPTRRRARGRRNLDSCHTTTTTTTTMRDVVSSLCSSMKQLLQSVIALWPIIGYMIQSIFFIKFSVVAAKDLECDLDIDTYYTFAFYSFCFKTMGVFLHPCQRGPSRGRRRLDNDDEAHPRAQKDDNKEKNKMCYNTCIVTIWHLVEIYWALRSTVWIPPNATCPETAPTYLAAAKDYFIVNMFLNLYAGLAVACLWFSWFCCIFCCGLRVETE